MNRIHCKLAHGFQQSGEIQNGFGKLSDEERCEMFARCGIRHAAAYGLQAAFCALTAKAALDGAAADRARIGIISNGGPWSADAALAFLRSIDERGHQFVNPLTLPATLVSAAPTASAAVVGARAFAFAAGFDELAFFEVLMRAHQLLRRDVANHVVALGCCTGSEALHGALETLGQSTCVFDCAIGILLSAQQSAPDASPATGFALSGAMMGVERHPWPAVTRRYKGELGEDGLISFPLEQPLSRGRAFSASGAVLCQAAMDDIGRTQTGPCEFVVSCVKGDTTGAALFTWRP